MQEIHDEKRIESILRQESKHFQKRPQSVHLLQYEKGELLTQPLMPLRQFLLIVSGTVQIFGMKRVEPIASPSQKREPCLAMLNFVRMNLARFLRRRRNRCFALRFLLTAIERC